MAWARMSTKPHGPDPEPASAKPAALSCVQAIDGGRATRLEIRAQPGAKRVGFAGFWNGRPKIAVSAPPENGRANAEVAQALADLFGIRRSAVSQISGTTSRAKAFRLECTPAEVEARLAQLNGEHGRSNHGADA